MPLYSSIHRGNEVVVMSFQSVLTSISHSCKLY